MTCRLELLGGIETPLDHAVVARQIALNHRVHALLDSRFELTFELEHATRLELDQQAAKLQGQAEKAISMGREDLAREALTRRSALSGQISDLKAQHAQLQGEEEKLTLAQQRLQAKVESFRTRKETIKATYTAAEAQTRINEAMSGIGEEMGDVGLAIQRAEDKTANMQARAGAIDELIASGALDDASQINRGDDISRELEAMSSESEVENELARLRAKANPQAIEAADDSNGILQAESEKKTTDGGNA